MLCHHNFSFLLHQLYICIHPAHFFFPVHPKNQIVDVHAIIQVHGQTHEKLGIFGIDKKCLEISLGPLLVDLWVCFEHQIQSLTRMAVELNVRINN